MSQFTAGPCLSTPDGRDTGFGSEMVRLREGSTSPGRDVGLGSCFLLVVKYEVPLRGQKEGGGRTDRLLPTRRRERGGRGEGWYVEKDDLFREQRRGVRGNGEVRMGWDVTGPGEGRVRSFQSTKTRTECIWGMLPKVTVGPSGDPYVSLRTPAPVDDVSRFLERLLNTHFYPRRRRKERDRGRRLNEGWWVDLYEDPELRSEMGITVPPSPIYFCSLGRRGRRELQETTGVESLTVHLHRRYE